MECRICGAIDEHRTYTAKEMMLGMRDEHRYFECKQCGCLQIVTIPPDLARYYPADYYSYSDAEKSVNPLKKALIRMRDTWAATRHCQIGRLLHFASPNDKLTSLRPLNLTKSMRVLDVGCGAGHLLLSLYEAGFTQVLGIDPFNREDIAYRNGLRIEKRDIFSETAQWDVVMFHHSFEHLVEQQATLQQAYDILKPGGVVLLRVPTVSSFAWQHYGVHWVQLDAPRHLYLHSLQSIQTLAKQTGFTLEQTLYDSNAFQFWGSEQYEQNIPLQDPRSYAVAPQNAPFDAQRIRDFATRANELNAAQQGDQAAFYLRKPG